ncbi:MAG: UvrD-helicase domain-containing protein [Candidatus Pacebacteria bacterium]|nr:UvrD-helicase domain-containing protein [Candidatus Paceibacterota bacterium]
MDILSGLNESQKEAVSHIEGPLLVVAGAGAGKTKVITHRIANLIQNGVAPEKILAVTFTNKAAAEMKNRVKNMLSEQKAANRLLRMPAMGTFHSVCASILRTNSGKIGLPASFSILDKEDSLSVIKKCLKALELNPKQFPPQKMQSLISKQKSELVKREEFSADAETEYFPKILSSVWEEYEKKLDAQKALDFDDLISETVFLFEKNPDVLEHYRDKWNYVLIDEYQDTNRSQYILTKMLAEKHRNICVVGDEDQSIYRFRGADFKNILNFEKDWPGARVVLLEQNYRSTQKILDAANSVIGKNKMRKPKKLFSLSEKGSGLALFDALNEKEEADIIAASTGELASEGIPLSEIAVLYRANFQSRALEESFLKRQIPYRVIGTRFFERKEVKDIIAYIKAALNNDDLLSVERIINEPGRGIGKIGFMAFLARRTLPPDKAKKIDEFFSFLGLAKENLLNKPLSEAICWIIEKSGYGKNLEDGTEEGLSRLENLKELSALSVKYDAEKPGEGVLKFLEDVALLTDQDTVADGEKAVKLMTVHSAKGLEFNSVFVAGLEEGLFPYSRPPQSIEDEEEERRLFYVALTRARKNLFLSFAYSRNFFGGKQINKPSRFLNEIPPELFRTIFGEEGERGEIATTNYLEI